MFLERKTKKFHSFNFLKDKNICNEDGTSIQSKNNCICKVF